MTSTSVWKALVWVGVTVFAVGLLVGLLPLSSQGEGCGSAFREGNPFLIPASCDDLRSLVRIPAIVLLVLGAGLGVLSAAMWSDARDRTLSNEETSARD